MTTIFFDLDGTLVDSSPGIKAAFAHTFSELNYPQPDPDTLRSFIGPPLEVSFAHLVGAERAQEAVSIYRDYYREQGSVYQAQVYDGIAPLLDDLKAAGHALYITTSKNQPMAYKMLEHFALKDKFDGIFGALEDSFHKADVIKRALSVSQASLDQTVIIGDTKYDMIGGKEVGIHTLGALWGFGTKEDLLENGAELLAETPQDVLNCLHQEKEAPSSTETF